MSFSSITHVSLQTINRYGFNSAGHQVVKENLQRHFQNYDLQDDDSGSGHVSLSSSSASTSGSSNDDMIIKKSSRIIVGVNLGKNKLSPEGTFDDYLKGIKVFSDSSSNDKSSQNVDGDDDVNSRIDYFVINISSPNTPGLRKLQSGDHLRKLIDALNQLKKDGLIQRPILIKISPDMTWDEKKQVASVVTSKNSIISGLIVSNTTISRPEITSQDEYSSETGGLSGAPLKQLATDTIRDMYKLTSGKIPIIGVGGIFTGEDAFEKIKAGASLIQIYSSLAIDGPPVVTSIKRDLAQILIRNGFSTVSDAVGCEHKK